MCSCTARPIEHGGNACLAQERGVRPERDPMEVVVSGGPGNLSRQFSGRIALEWVEGKRDPDARIRWADEATKLLLDIGRRLSRNGTSLTRQQTALRVARVLLS